MTLFSDRDERILENLRIINSRFARKKQVVPRGERPSPFGKGGGAPTVVVASAFSTQFSKDRADFQCDGGPGDRIIIQAALDACSSTGGIVWLCEGGYFCEIPTTGPAITVPQTVKLLGVGSSMDGGAYLEQSNVSDPGRQAMVRLTSHSEMSSLTVYTFDSALPVQFLTGAGVIKVSDCWIETRDSAGIEGADNSAVWIERNTFVSSGSFATAADSQIHLSGDALTDIWINRNFISSGYHGIFIDGNQGRNYIHDNYVYQSWYSGIRIQSDDNPIFATTISRNLVQTPGTDSDGSTGEAGIYVSADSADVDPTQAQSNGLIIADNPIEVAATCHGIRLTDVCLVNVHDNYIEQQGLHGIYLENANGNQIHDNTIQEPNQFPDATLDGIHLVTSDDNYIRMNTVVEHTGGSPSSYQYGINVSDAASNRNILFGNDLRLAGSGTGFINDAGTGTIISNNFT